MNRRVSRARLAALVSEGAPAMRHRTARLAVGAVVLTLLLLAVGGTSTVDVAPTAIADRPQVAFCVEDTTRARAAVRAAVAELDTLDEVAATHEVGVGDCAGDPVRTVRVTQTDLPRKLGGAVTTGHSGNPLVKISDGRRYAQLSTPEQSIIVLHELMHVVLGNPDGPEWDGSHTARCDSVLADDSRCVLRLDGLTDYDRAQVARKYSPEKEGTRSE